MTREGLIREDHLPFRERLKKSEERRRKRMKPLFKLAEHEIDHLIYIRGSKVRIGRPLGGSYIEVGKMYNGPEGMRLVLKANSSNITFLVDKYVFRQSTNDFAEDWIWTVGEKAARSALASVAFAEGVVEFMMGFASVATGGIGIAASLGAGTISFYSNNKDNFEKWYYVLKAFWKVEAYLYKHTPRLWLILNAILTQGVIIKGVKAVAPALLSVILKPGRLLGKMGGRLALKSIGQRFSAFETIIKIARDVALECSKNIPAAIGKSVGENIGRFKDRAKQIIDVLRAAGIEITTDEAKEILQEVANHASVLKDTLRDISKALGY